MGATATRGTSSGRINAPLAVAYGLFFLSGVAGLGYEIVWTRAFALGLGHELPSMLSVVAAYFGGFALGAFALDRIVSRSTRPGHWYAVLEALVGVWALVSLVLVPWLNDRVPQWVGLEPSPWRHWAVAFAVPFLALLPATAALGATLPAMERLVARLTNSGARVAGLYAVNTAGAVTGILVTTYVLSPALGNRAATIVLAALSFAVALVAWRGPAAGEERRADAEHTVTGVPRPWRLATTLGLTGLLGIGFEVLGVRTMSLVFENTVFSFAAALCAYLVGTAVGAALYQRRALKRDYAKPLSGLLAWTSVACLVGVATLRISPGLYGGIRSTLGAGVVGSLIAELVVALAVFLVPTALMGATFSHLAQAARGKTGGVGWALGVNTLGACVAPALVGVALLSVSGLKISLLVVALGYLALVPISGARWPRAVPAGLAVVLLVFAPADLRLIGRPEGTRVVDYREGVMASVAVLEDGQSQRVLKINNHFEGGTLGAFGETRQAHLPLLLHPEPQTVLFLGFGSGVTVGAATEYADLEITAVELLPEVVQVRHWFSPVNRDDELAAEALVVADARRFIRASRERFDVIVADLFHPARDGSGALYTVEHFRAIRDRLEPGGLFCQWLPLHELDLESFRLILRTLLDVFPFARAYTSHFNLETPALAVVAREEPRHYPEDWYGHRVATWKLQATLLEVGLRNDVTLFGSLLASDPELRSFAGSGPLNTDARPLVTYRAPLFAYGGYGTSYGRLQALLSAWKPSAGDVLVPEAASTKLGERLDAYLAARDLFFEARVFDREGSPEEAVRALLASARASAEFRASWLAVLERVESLAAVDRAAAEALFSELWQASETDADARRVLQQFRATRGLGR